MTPQYVTNLFKSLGKEDQDYYPNDTIELLNTDIEIYTMLYEINYEFYQATTYLNTNYSDPATLTVIKL